jgi:hypothetical protein
MDQFGNGASKPGDDLPEAKAEEVEMWYDAQLDHTFWQWSQTWSEWPI